MRTVHVVLFVSWLVASPLAAQTVKVGTYNIHSGVGKDCKLDLPRVAGVIASAGLDVVTLQEVDSRVGLRKVNGCTDGQGNDILIDTGTTTEQAKEIARLASFPYQSFCRATDTGAGSFGNAILSKYPMGSIECLPLVRKKWDEATGGVDDSIACSGQERSALLAEVKFGSKTLLVVSTHLHGVVEASADPYCYAVSSTKQLQARVTEKGNDVQVLLTGDFNTATTEPMYHILENTFFDVWAMVGTSNRPRVDYLWVGKPSNLKRGRTPTPLTVMLQPEPSTTLASDHRLLWASFRLPPGPNDGSFEKPITSGYIYAAQGSAWTFSGASPNGSGVAHQTSRFPNHNPPSSNGPQVAFLQGVSSIAQQLTGLEIGTTYTVSFMAAQRNRENTLGQTFVVKRSATVLDQFALPQSETEYRYYATSFKASATEHVLRFEGTNLNGGDNTILLDDVQVAPASLENGSFEVPLISGYAYGPSVDSWVFEAKDGTNGSGVSASGSKFTASNGFQAENQVAFLQGEAIIYGLAMRLEPGLPYEISFSAAQRNNGQSGQTWDVAVSELFGPRVKVASFSPAQSQTALVRYTASFVAETHYAFVYFVGTNLNGGDNTIFLDDVRIQPLVP